jgi:hypothetical protein
MTSEEASAVKVGLRVAVEMSNKGDPEAVAALMHRIEHVPLGGDLAAYVTATIEILAGAERAKLAAMTAAKLAADDQVAMMRAMNARKPPDDEN